MIKKLVGAVIAATAVLATLAAPAGAAAPAARTASSSPCGLHSVLEYRNAKTEFRVKAGITCTSSQHGLTVTEDFFGSNWTFVEIGKKCSGTSSCWVTSKWGKNPAGTHKYYNAVEGSVKKHWYSITGYYLHRYTYYV